MELLNLNNKKIDISNNGLKSIKDSPTKEHT